MKQTINGLIQNVLQKVNVCGNGQSASGDLVAAALSDLNEAIAELNLEEYLSYNVITRDVKSNKTEIKIGITDDCDIILGEVPLYLKSVARKSGNHYLPLTIVNQTVLDETTHTRTTHPLCYTYELETDEEGNVYGKITLNGDCSQGIRVTWLGELPKYQINDEINLPVAYINLIDSALCVKTCQRYKLEFIQMYSDEFENLKSNIQRINNSNRPLVIDHHINYDYRDNYYDGFAGTGWSM